MRAATVLSAYVRAPRAFILWYPAARRTVLLNSILSSSTMNINPTNRFTGRTDNYKAYRPSYPQQVVEYIKNIAAPSADVRIADLGAGTGIFSELLLQAAYSVLTVEPNTEMRQAAEEKLQHYANYISIAATAEQTTIAANSIDIITAAQAFHWFDLETIKQEFERILKPSGSVVLIWNIMRIDTAFMQAYKTFRKQYEEDIVRPLRGDIAAINAYFAPLTCTEIIIPHSTFLTYDELQGLLLSSSLVNNSGDEMLNGLRELFDTYAVDDKVEMRYNTMMYHVRY